MNNSSLTIRAMTRNELDVAIDWAADEGWNPGLHDADAFYAADPDGFLIGLINNEPVACISAVKYADSFGFIGFYIVAPEHRGRGYGMQIWNRGMDRLKTMNIGLDGVVEQQPNYKKSGFKLAYSNIRFEGKGLHFDGVEPMTRPYVGLLDFGAVANYDRKCFPSTRKEFLTTWLGLADSHTLLIFNNRGLLSGYGTIRECRVGYKIGPLFADDPKTAEALFKSLCHLKKPTAPVYLDVPETNKAAMLLATKYGLNRVFGTARMYTGEFPGIDVSRIYGVTSFELG